MKRQGIDILLLGIAVLILLFVGLSAYATVKQEKMQSENPEIKAGKALYAFREGPSF